jgi:hypothetical protein
MSETVLFILFVGIFSIGVLGLIKTEVTSRQMGRIIDAIYLYQVANIEDFPNFKVDYSDMKTFNEVMFNIRDWGYTSILPQDKYELIKPYINKREKEKTKC